MTFRSKTPKLYLLALTICIACTFVLSGSANINIQRMNIQVAAHRGGSSGAPENSIRAISNAMAIGASVIEIDVQMTKDGVVVLNHDMDLQRVAGVESEVSQLTYSELKFLDIGIDDKGGHSRDQIPTLGSVLTLVRDKATLLIDIKYDSYSKDLAKNIVTLLEEYHMVDQCMIQSFNNGVLVDIRQLNSDIMIGQLLRTLAVDVKELDVDFYAVKHTVVSDEFIDKAHEMGRPVWVWTVNKENSVDQVLKHSIDGIITDYPERVQNILDED